MKIKKRKSNYFYKNPALLFAAVLLIINIGLIMKIKYPRSDEGIIITPNTEIEYLNDCIEKLSANEISVIPSNIYDTLTLSMLKHNQITDQNYLLLLRVTESNCSECIESEMSHFNKLINYHGLQDVGYILTKFHNKGEQRVFNKVNSINNTYNYTGNLEFDHLTTPVIFLYDIDAKRISHRFVPWIQYKERTENYFKKMSKLLKSTS